MNRPAPALMMFAASEHDANLYYAVKFVVPDPFLFFRIRGRSHIVLSDLEYDRARKQAKVDRVERLYDWAARAKAKGVERPTAADVAALFLKSHGVRKAQVPQDFPLGFALAMKSRGILLQAKNDPFWEERVLKSRAEVELVRQALRHTETAIHRAEDLLAKSVIRGKRVYHRGSIVTSELLKRVINVSLMENQCVANHTIVAPGDQGCDPHCEGSGPITAHQSLVVDVFPRSGETLYFADITRTFVKGKASEALKRQYEAVRAGQQVGLDKIRAGANGKEIHQAITAEMESRGYRTERKNGVMTGFFHGTGHGLGLEVHEAPRINSTDHILRAGEVVTDEPGLYYPGVGAIRLEDLVVVTKTGNENLTAYPKRLEIR